MIRFSTFLFALLFGSGVFPSSGAAFSCPDLALVLAIDASGSIDARDFTLQQAGYAAAFTNPEVLDAMAGAGMVDVAVVFWGDETLLHKLADGWTAPFPGQTYPTTFVTGSPSAV